MRVREPGVKRKERDLDREREEESEEEPGGSRIKPRDLPGLDGFLNSHKIEATHLRVQPQDRGQHKHRRDHRVEEEFDGRVDLSPVAIDADQQGHRDQRRFPEEIEEKKVERGEDPDQGGLEDQQQDEEFLHALVDRIPRDQHA
jgi:hypothetical protein